jgi:hypothetical protein
MHDHIHYFRAVYRNPERTYWQQTSWIKSHYLRLHLALVQYTSCLPRVICFFLSRIYPSNMRATSPTQLLLCHFIAQNHKVTYKLCCPVGRNILHFPPTLCYIFGAQILLPCSICIYRHRWAVQEECYWSGKSVKRECPSNNTAMWWIQDNLLYREVRRLGWQ